ncbi:UDP-glucosyl transferase 74B1 [Perilla frutescens var. hirtella]|uniref:anthocyanidin 3-O-glucoside 5-O-glucosyltransferase n=1 Tax=Perilla frutescens var. hirtella TaxID=608512 RepID=A0AAD4NW85_PERFH|nr:UDP-glucosyl transferase 74B1 [Perilla frutescens var. hirtella]
MEKSNEVVCIPTPHVMLLPYPSQGHINPLLQFAKRLAAKGVRATLATTKNTVNSIHAATVAVEPISDGFDDGGSAKAGKEGDYLSSLREHGSESLSQLLNKYKNTKFPVSCIIYDAFFPWALDVAKQHGVFGASFFTNSAAVCAIFSHIHGGTLTLPVNVDDDKPLVLPGLPPLNSCDVPTFIRAPESYPAYLAMKLSQFSNLHEADFVFANTFLDLERQEAESVEKSWPARLVGPMVPSAYLDGRIEGDKGYGASLWKPLSEQCAAWLNTKPRESVMYVSFGSMVSLSSKQMEEMAWALLSTNSHFLWVVRETERQKLPAGFMDSIKGKGLIVSWCNQLETLAHPAIGCFLTHCGWNSTLEGLALGVPMVALPQWSDQMMDAKFIEEIWGVGVRAKEDEFGVAGREELLYCLKAVMEGERREEMRRNAAKWRELATKATHQGGSSDNAIDEFVVKLKLVANEGF